jgi:hypothetical protein
MIRWGALKLGVGDSLMPEGAPWGLKIVAGCEFVVDIDRRLDVLDDFFFAFDARTVLEAAVTFFHSELKERVRFLAFCLSALCILARRVRQVLCISEAGTT